MSLAPGTRIGPYEIVSIVGAGGMGEVYRARDPKLNRDVAIKVLPDLFASDAERLARFAQEAQTLASLNHPNIAHIHGLEESGGVHAIVMELVEGEDLAQRIAHGAIPLDEALPIAKQIAEALEGAHEKGITHRDLKPANIKMRPDGIVKVLDFGLAKATAPVGSAANVSQSPTITTPAMMTGVGVILGTAAYMSPEQAKGREADKRSDVWAFGAVLYEMLTGTPAFGGEDITEVLGAVVRLEPDWAALPSDVPPLVRTLLQQCLIKDRRRRVADISAALFALDQAASLTLSIGTTSFAPAPRRPLWKRTLPLVVTALVVCVLTAGAMWKLYPSAPAPVVRFALLLPNGQQWSPGGRSLIAVSPDGTQIVYSANRRLYLWSLSNLEGRPITGADNSTTYRGYPVFSPDGRSIVYWDSGDSFVANRRGTIKKIALSSGSAVPLCQADSPDGMSWAGNSIFFGQGSQGIMRVSENGGKPEQVVSVNAGELAHGPQLLPDGQTLLLTVATGSTADRWDKARIVAESLRSHERTTVIEAGSDARYLRTGHLLYARSGVVYAVSFDVKRLAPSGDPVSIVEGVRRSTQGGTGGSAHLGVSDTGVLAYIPGPVSMTKGQLSIALFDRKGGSTLLNIPPGPYQVPRMSPDGTRIAFGSDDGNEASIWVYELAGTSSARRLTFEGQGHNRFPVWSANSQRVAFQSDRLGNLGIFWQRADGAGTAEPLTTADEGASHIPESWHPDGEHLLYNVSKGGTSSLWVFSLKDKKAVRYGTVESPAGTLTGAVFSPNGRWVAYASGEARTQSAVYVQPFPPTGTRYLISKNTDDGHHPVWSPDGAELLFSPGRGPDVNAVPVTTQPSFTFSEATLVLRPFQLASPPTFERPFDITGDRRFLALTDRGQTQSGASGTQQINVVLNWFEELQARVPTK